MTIAEADSGASNHYVPTSYKDALLHLKEAPGPTVSSANGTTMQSLASGTLKLSKILSPTAQRAHVLNDLKTPLLSMGQLCDNDCTIELSKTKLNVLKNNNIIMQGKRNLQDGLWDIPLPPVTCELQQHHANILICRDKSKSELAQYLHAACNSPSISTFIRAIKNNIFLSWPGLTADLITKHLPKSLATAKGHLQYERKNLQSTKELTDEENDFFPSSESPNLKTHKCYATVHTCVPTNKV